METINAQIFKALRISELSKVPVLLIGNPGCGKTTTVEMFCRIAGYELVLLRGSQSTPEEILGFEVNEGNSDRTTTHLIPTWYADVKKFEKEGKRVLLFLDEITTANEPTQGALLHLIFERKVTRTEKLPDDCLVVSAGNYSGNLSSGFNLIPPLMNRFMIINIMFSDSDLDSFFGKYQVSTINPEIELKELYDNEEKPLDQGFINITKMMIEKCIKEYTRSLIKSGELDLNITEMSDVYTNSQTSILPGFVSPRSLNYLREAAIYTYLTYGKSGISSDTFDLITKGLVGIGFVNRDKVVTPVSLHNKYKQAILGVCIELDKNKSKSIVGYSDAISKILGFDSSTYDKDSDRKDKVRIFTIEEIKSLTKVFNDALLDNSIKKIETPINQNIIVTIAELVKYTSDRISKDNIRQELIDGDLVDLNKINGYLHIFNSNIELYDTIHKFISKKNFNYPNQVIDYISNTISLTIDRNEFMVRSSVDMAKKRKPDSIDTLIQVIPTKSRYNKIKMV